MDKSILKFVGQRIRDLRKNKGLSQEELGEKAGFHFSYIGGIERAEKNISLLNLEKIANSLNVTVYDLFHYGKYKRLSSNERDQVINRIVEQLMTMNHSSLHKVEIILNELFKES